MRTSSSAISVFILVLVAAAGMSSATTQVDVGSTYGSTHVVNLASTDTLVYLRDLTITGNLEINAASDTTYPQGIRISIVGCTVSNHIRFLWVNAVDLDNVQFIDPVIEIIGNTVNSRLHLLEAHGVGGRIQSFSFTRGSIRIEENTIASSFFFLRSGDASGDTAVLNTNFDETWMTVRKNTITSDFWFVSARDGSSSSYVTMNRPNISMEGNTLQYAYLFDALGATASLTYIQNGGSLSFNGNECSNRFWFNRLSSGASSQLFVKNDAVIKIRKNIFGTYAVLLQAVASCTSSLVLGGSTLSFSDNTMSQVFYLGNLVGAGGSMSIIANSSTVDLSRNTVAIAASFHIFRQKIGTMTVSFASSSILNVVGNSLTDGNLRIGYSEDADTIFDWRFVQSSSFTVMENTLPEGATSDKIDIGRGSTNPQRSRTSFTLQSGSSMVVSRNVGWGIQMFREQSDNLSPGLHSTFSAEDSSIAIEDNTDRTKGIELLYVGTSALVHATFLCSSVSIQNNVQRDASDSGILFGASWEGGMLHLSGVDLTLTISNNFIGPNSFLHVFRAGTTGAPITNVTLKQGSTLISNNHARYSEATFWDVVSATGNVYGDYSSHDLTLRGNNFGILQLGDRNPWIPPRSSVRLSGMTILIEENSIHNKLSYFRSPNTFADVYALNIVNNQFNSSSVTTTTPGLIDGEKSVLYIGRLNQLRISDNRVYKGSGFDVVAEDVIDPSSSQRILGCNLNVPNQTYINLPAVPSMMRYFCTRTSSQSRGYHLRTISKERTATEELPTPNPQGDDDGGSSTQTGVSPATSITDGSDVVFVASFSRTSTANYTRPTTASEFAEQLAAQLSLKLNRTVDADTEIQVLEFTVGAADATTDSATFRFRGVHADSLNVATDAASSSPSDLQLNSVARWTSFSSAFSSSTMSDSLSPSGPANASEFARLLAQRLSATVQVNRTVDPETEIEVLNFDSSTGTASFRFKGENSGELTAVVRNIATPGGSALSPADIGLGTISLVDVTSSNGSGESSGGAHGSSINGISLSSTSSGEDGAAPQAGGNSESNTNSLGLTPTATIGIIVGGAVFLAMLAALGLFLILRKKETQSKSHALEEMKPAASQPEKVGAAKYSPQETSIFVE